jgi:excisionase family DNA binding protein
MRQFNDLSISVWLTADEATVYLGLPSREALYQLARKGVVPSYRLGERRIRFKRTELDSHIEGKRCAESDLGAPCA